MLNFGHQLFSENWWTWCRISQRTFIMLVELLTFCFLLSSLNIQAIFFYGFNSPAIPAAELPTTMINCSALQSSIQALCEQQVQKTSDLCEREQRLRGRPVFVLHGLRSLSVISNLNPKKELKKKSPKITLWNWEWQLRLEWEPSTFMI